MTDAELYQMLKDAETQHQAAAEAEAYARGKRDALREILERLSAAARPVEAPPTPTED